MLSEYAEFDILSQRSEVIRGNNRWEIFLDTIDHRNLKLGTVVVCDVGLPKMYILMTFHEGQRSSGATICAKIGIFAEKRNFSQRLLITES